MCINCGNNNCNHCYGGNYSFNWFNTTGLPCNPCSQTPVCSKQLPAFCTFYNGPVLTDIGLGTNVNVELILTTISIAIGTINAALEAQSEINQNILDALNDINDRINVIDSGSHDPYEI